jgi:signal peptidase I
MHDLAPVMSAVIQRTGKIELPSAGISMYPLIKEGNVSTFLSVQREELKLGDICLFVTDQGELIGHRLYAVKQDGSKELFIFKGDTCFEPDDPLPFTSIMGRWSGVRRNSRFQAANHWRSRLLAVLALRVPKWHKVIRWCAERNERYM